MPWAVLLVQMATMAMMGSQPTVAASHSSSPAAQGGRGLLQTQSYQYAGSFQVGAGPSYADTPAPVSCQEACAQVFGSAYSGYQGSVADDSISNTCWYDQYGLSCGTTFSDTFSSILSLPYFLFQITLKLTFVGIVGWVLSI